MKRIPSDDLWSRARSRAPMKLLSVAVSAALLFFLYRKLDHHAIAEVLASADRSWLIISVGMIVPITILNALRFRWVVPSTSTPGYTDAIAMTVISNGLNMFLPAKLGDLAKSHFIHAKHGASSGVAVAIIVYERLCDVFAIATWCLLGWLSGLVEANLDAAALVALCAWLVSGALILSGRTAGVLLDRAKELPLFKNREKLAFLAQGWPDLHLALGRRSWWLVLYSVGLWFLHLTQIWMFTVAVGASVPFLASLALAPVVLLCGFVPFTFGGIGPRDAAIVYLFATYMAPEVAAAVGLLTISRSIVPALAAIPFLRRYLVVIFGRATPESRR